MPFFRSSTLPARRGEQISEDADPGAWNYRSQRTGVEAATSDPRVGGSNPPGRVELPLAAAETLGEADVRCVDVEYAEFGVARIAEAVPDPGRRGHERTGLGAEGVVADEKFRVAREDVERVHEVRVHVRIDALEVGPEPKLDRFELRKLAEDAVMALDALDVLAALGPQRHDAVHTASMQGRRRRLAPVTAKRPVVGIVSPGAMGSALGARLRDGGSRVLVALDGRSERSRRLGTDAGLEDAGSLAALLSEAAVVLSVVPPGSALEAAAAIAANAGSARPLVADLNAVAPATIERIAETLRDVGLDLVDGSISGPPPHGEGSTRVYLAGPRAAEVADLPFAGVERVLVGGSIGSASAVKMCTASVYKGRVALLAQALRTAHVHGVVEHVLDDLAETGLADPERTGATLGRASAKAWRYVAEMEEIAATQAGAGLTPELFRALAEVYAELADRAVADAPEDVRDGIALETVLDRLSARQVEPEAAR